MFLTFWVGLRESIRNAFVEAEFKRFLGAVIGRSELSWMGGGRWLLKRGSR